MFLRLEEFNIKMFLNKYSRNECSSFRDSLPFLIFHLKVKIELVPWKSNKLDIC